MQRVMRVLLVEDDKELCEEFSKCFDSEDSLELVGITDSESRALEMMRKMTPDVVILDLELEMGEGNGITFLSKLGKKKHSNKPYVVVNTNNSSRTTSEIVRELGADFIMHKHQQGHSPEAVAELLLVIASKIIFAENSEPESEFAAMTENGETQEREGLRERILEELNKVAISPKRKGYVYLADAIEICSCGYVPNVSALIGEKHGKSAKSVEHAMQNAIDDAWDNNDIGDLGVYYRARISPKRVSPTVMEFIRFYSAKFENEN